MRTLVLALALVTASAPALAQSLRNPPTSTIQCVGVSGKPEPVVCKAPASRLDAREDICTCPVNGMRTEVAICAKGERETPDSLAANRVRREAARDGSLIGDTFEGRPICVAPRNLR